MGVEDKYTKQQLLDFVDLDKNLDWPDDFHKWINDLMANEIFDRWVEGHDSEDYYDLAKEMIEDNRHLFGEKK